MANIATTSVIKPATKKIHNISPLFLNPFPMLPSSTYSLIVFWLTLKLLYTLVVSSVIIAYEPVWAIGTGNACSIDDAKEAGELIRSEVSGDIFLIYGGSAKKDNAEGYLKEAGFQGLLVGGASLKADEFAGIVEKAN